MYQRCWGLIRKSLVSFYLVCWYFVTLSLPFNLLLVYLCFQWSITSFEASYIRIQLHLFVCVFCFYFVTYFNQFYARQLFSFLSSFVFEWSTVSLVLLVTFLVNVQRVTWTLRTSHNILFLSNNIFECPNCRNFLHTIGLSFFFLSRIFHCLSIYEYQLCFFLLLFLLLVILLFFLPHFFQTISLLLPILCTLVLTPSCSGPLVPSFWFSTNFSWIFYCVPLYRMDWSLAPLHIILCV